MKIDDYRTLKHLNLRFKNQNHNIWDKNPAEKGMYGYLNFLVAYRQRGNQS